jgi:putative intracellular protease/amidase
MRTVLVPIPARDFDPTEVAVSWRVLTRLGHGVRFATPHGEVGEPDEIMVSGRGLDPWGFLPLLRDLPAVGLVLRANRDARQAMAALRREPAYMAPVSWEDALADPADALLLPGGHRARGMREYLESELLQRLVVSYFSSGRPVGAICHGVLLAARSTDPLTGRSVLHGRRTTGLTWQLERTAWRLTRVSRFWDPHYYRTYREGPGEPAGYASVEKEVERALADVSDFLDVPVDDPLHRLKTSGRARDTFEDPRPAFVVRDGNYVSARWPGDTHTFARTLAEVIEDVPAAAITGEHDEEVDDAASSG